MNEGWRERAVAQEELYDLTFDPAEGGNVANDAAYAGVLAEMKSRLDNWMRRTSDPLLSGDIPLPPTARLWSVDATDPAGPMLPTGAR